MNQNLLFLKVIGLMCPNDSKQEEQKTSSIKLLSYIGSNFVRLNVNTVLCLLMVSHYYLVHHLYARLNLLIKFSLQIHGSEHSIHEDAQGEFQEEYLLSSERMHSHP